jgi:two-component system, NtrC family, sensor kinase
LVTVIAGVLMIRGQVFDQAQDRVSSDMESAKEIYNNYLERLKDSLRIHATRMIVYGALERRDSSGLVAEMERIRSAERLDILTLTDANGKVFYRACNPAFAGDDQQGDAFVQLVLRDRLPVSSTDIVPRGELVKESERLAEQALMDISYTPKAAPSEMKQISAGMMLKGGNSSALSLKNIQIHAEQILRNLLRYGGCAYSPVSETSIVEFLRNLSFLVPLRCLRGCGGRSTACARRTRIFEKR